MVKDNPGNSLLENLSRDQCLLILDNAELVDQVFGDILYVAGQPINHVYFPRTSIISLMMKLGSHPPIEMGLIGSEGMLGVTLILGVKSAPMQGIVQGDGSAWRMEAAKFLHILNATPDLLSLLNRYTYVLMEQLSQTAACTRFHPVESRLARWLLMTHDRAQGDHFYLTHQILADMLGVQRSAITIAAGALQKKNIIWYTRGDIHILNRRALEAVSCGCYEELVEEYKKLLN